MERTSHTKYYVVLYLSYLFTCPHHHYFVLRFDVVDLYFGIRAVIGPLLLDNSCTEEKPG